MSLIQVREKLQAVDRALGELQKSLLVAGGELSKADSLIDSVMGGVKRARQPRKVRELVDRSGGDGKDVQLAAKAVSEDRPTRKRGRRTKWAAQETNSPVAEV